MGALRGIMIVLVGVLNVIYGVAAIGDSRFFVNDATYILSGLNTWGWILLILGAVQIVAAYSIWKGGQGGRWFGIAVAMFYAVAALMAISADPFWSLAVFTLDILVIYGLAAYGSDPRRRVTIPQRTTPGRVRCVVEAGGCVARLHRKGAVSGAH